MLVLIPKIEDLQVSLYLYMYRYVVVMSIVGPFELVQQSMTKGVYEIHFHLLILVFQGFSFLPLHQLLSNVHQFPYCS